MDIKVPAMGESVTEGTLANWLVKPGQAVKQDDPIAEIETDKVAIEVPAPAAGVITELMVRAGMTLAPGTYVSVAAAVRVTVAPASRVRRIWIPARSARTRAALSRLMRAYRPAWLAWRPPVWGVAGKLVGACADAVFMTPP